MKIAAVIAEYNPFHNGHAYHLAQVRAKTGADYVMIVLSGNFTQRGVPAVIDKYARTKMALQNGADLVLELPCFFACSSAELFAAGAVTLLHNLGVVDFLCFGCEDDNLLLFNQAADVLCKEPSCYQEALKAALKKGASFPAARSLALTSYLQSSKSPLSLAPDFLSSPNNILALEYIKALKNLSSDIQPVAVKRKGSGYHDASLNTAYLLSSDEMRDACYSSALAIRNALTGSHTLTEKELVSSLKKHVPAGTLAVLKSCWQKSCPITTKDFSYLLHYKLLSEAGNGFEQYLDVTSDLSEKIKKNLHSYTSFDSFCMLLKSKDMTYSRICRCMLHILLDIQKDTLSALKQESFAPYARILGFCRESTALLTAIKKHSSIPMIATAADAKAYLADLTDKAFGSRRLFETDLRAASIYSAAVQNHFHTKTPGEFGAPVLKI